MTKRGTRALFGALVAVAVAAGGVVLAPPAAAATGEAPVILNGATSGQWLESVSLTRDTTNRVLHATFLVEHDPGRTIAGVDVGTFGTQPATVSTTPGSGVSTVKLSFVPTPPASGWACNIFGLRVTRQVRTYAFSVVDDTGAASAAVSGSVAFDDPGCIFELRMIVRDASQSTTTAAPGEPVTFQFTPTSEFAVFATQVTYRWRRLADGLVSSQQTVPAIDGAVSTLDVAFPARGRYVVEAKVDGGTAPGWWRLGAVDVNDASTSVAAALTLSGDTIVAGATPSVNAGDALLATATVDDAGGVVQQVEWDAEGDGGFERVERTAPSVADGDVVHTAVAGSQLEQAVDTSTPGLRTIVVRATDNGALDLSDGVTASVTATAQVLVNAAPIAVDQAVTTSEDTDVAFALAAADPDGQPAPLSAAVVDPPDHGVLDIVGTTATYVPDPDWFGTDSFTWTASDGPGDGAWATSAPATATITVTSVNDVPVATPQTVTVDEDGALDITLGGTDVEDPDLDVAVVGEPGHGSVQCTGPECTYTPAADFHGADSFTFAVTDDDGAQGTATVAITVDPVNDAPTAADLDIEAVEDEPQIVLLVGGDVDGDALAFALVAGPGNGNLDCTGDECTYTGAADFNGTDSFTYSVTDPDGAFGTATVTIDVLPVNDAPVATPQDVESDEDTPVVVALAGTDVDGDPLTASPTTSPANGALASVGGGTATYVPASDWWGIDSFDFSVTDPDGASGSAQVRITIHPVNDAPVADDVDATTDEDTPVTVSLVASDVDGDELTWEIVEGPSAGRVDGDGPDVTYVPDPDANGVDSFVVRVTDPSGATDDAVVTVGVAAVNDAPVAHAGAVTLDEDSEATFGLAATDVDGDALAFTIDAGPEHGTLSCDGSSCTYRPDPDWNGGDTVVFTATDPAGAASTAVVTLTVEPVNDAPVAADLAVATVEDVAVPVTLSATDVDADPLTFEVTSDPSLGAISCDGPACTYTPDPDAHGADSFAYLARDTSGATGTAIVTVSITEVNDAPVAPDITVANDRQKSVTFTLAATDVDGDILEYTVVTPPTSGTVSCTTAGTCVYAPTAGFAGTDGMTYRADDGRGGTADGTVTFVVTVPDVVELLHDLADTTTSHADGSPPRPLVQQLRNAVDHVVGGRPRPACSALTAYEAILRNVSSRTYTVAERDELLADSRYIRAVIGC